MIIEAREIRENQNYRSNALSCAVTSTEPKDQHFKVINIYEYFVVQVHYINYLSTRKMI